MEYASELEETLKAAAGKIERGEEAKELLEEADELYAQFKIEARSKADRERASAFDERIRELRNRALLFEGRSQEPTASAGRQRLVDAKSRALESGKRIDQTQEMVAEIEETGADIMTELQRNKETIGKINGHVKETKGELDKADKTVTKMGKWWSRW